MVIKESEVQNNLIDVVDEALVDRIELMIDAKLSDPSYCSYFLRWNREAPEEGHFYRIPVGVEINQGTKNALIKKYIEAGWASVVIQNSSENGERPGICSVRLTIPGENKNNFLFETRPATLDTRPVDSDLLL